MQCDTYNRMSDAVFLKQKENGLKSLDLSRKGAIDDRVVNLVFSINQSDDYFTTSSCSGRICLYEQPADDGYTGKKNCVWLCVTHNEIDEGELITALRNSKTEAFLKFEPLIMHMRCRDLTAAQRMLTTAVSCGYRNSGVTPSSHGKITVAIRATNGLEIPVTRSGENMISPQYMSYIIELLNRNMQRNFKSIERLSTAITSLLSECKDAKGNQPVRKRVRPETAHKQNTGTNVEVDLDYDMGDITWLSLEDT